MIRYILLFMVLVHANAHSTNSPSQDNYVNGNVQCFYSQKYLEGVNVVAIDPVTISNPTTTNLFGVFQMNVRNRKPGDVIGIKLDYPGFCDLDRYRPDGIVLAASPSYTHRLYMVPNVDSICAFYPEWNQVSLEEEQSHLAFQLDTLPVAQAEERFKLKRLLATNATKQAQNQKVKDIANELLALGLPKGMLLPGGDTTYRLALYDFALGKPLATLNKLAAQVMPSIQSPTLLGAKYMLAARAHMVTLNFDTALLYYDSAVMADTSREDYTFEYGLVLMAEERLAEADEMFEYVAGNKEDAGLLTASKLNKQTSVTLMGEVVQQNSGKRPLEGALIVPDTLANPTTTNTQGNFWLEYLGKGPGEYTHLSVTYEDWEVVNDEVLHATIPAQADSTPLRIVMCPKGEWRANALAYYKVNEGVIQEAYRDSLAVLNAIVASNWQEQQRLDSIKNVLEAQVHAAFDWAWEVSEKFARVNLDDAGPLYKEAFGHFQQGEFEKAQEVLMAADLPGQVADVAKEEQRLKGLGLEVAERRAEIEAKGRQYAEAAILKGRLHVAKLQFPKAYEAYEWAIQFDSTNLENWLEYGNLLQDQNQEPKALPIYLHVSNAENVEEDLYLKTLHNLGIIYRVINQYDLAERAYRAAFERYAALSVARPDKYTPPLASTLHNLGNFYMDLNQYDSALSCLQYAQNIRTKFSEVYPEKYAPLLASTLNNLGNLYSDLNQYDSAVNAYQMAREIRDTLNLTNSEKHAPGLANTLSNLGNLYRKLNQYDSALSFCQQSREQYAVLSAANPEKYAPDLAMSLNALSILYQEHNQYDSAMIFLQQSREQYATLSASNPEKYSSDLAMVLNNLSILYQEFNQYDSALSLLQQSREQYAALCLSNSEKYTPGLAKSLNSLGILYKDLNQYDSALSTLQQAREIWAILSTANPAKYLPELAGTLHNLGILYKNLNQYDSAISAYRQAREIQTVLSVENSATHTPGLARTLNNMGNLYLELNQYDSALNTFRQVQEIQGALSTTNPEKYALALAVTLHNLGLLYKGLNQYDSALSTYQQAREQLATLSAANPEVYTPYLAHTLNNLGLLYQGLNQYDSALSAYQKARDCYMALNTTNLEVYAPYLARVINNLGNLYSDLNQYDSALNFYKQAHEQYVMISLTAPEKYAIDLAGVLNNLGNIYGELKQYDSALNFYQQARELFSDLSVANPAKYAPYYAMALNNLGNFHVDLNQYDSALSALQNAREIRAALSAANPEAHSPYLARTLFSLGVVYFEGRLEYDSAIWYCQQAIKSFALLPQSVTAYHYNAYLAFYELLGAGYKALLQGKPAVKAVALAELQPALSFIDSLPPDLHEHEHALLIKKRYNEIQAYDETTPALQPNAFQTQGREKLREGDTLGAMASLQEAIADYDQQLQNEGHKLSAAWSMAYSLKLLASITTDTTQLYYKTQEIAQRQSVCEQLPDNQTVKTFLADAYGELSRYRLFAQDYAGAEQAAKQGLAVDANRIWINTCLAHAYLLQGKWQVASTIYQTYMDQTNLEAGQTYQKIFLEDLAALEATGITHPDVARARALLVANE